MDKLECYIDFGTKSIKALSDPEAFRDTVWETEVLARSVGGNRRPDGTVTPVYYYKVFRRSWHVVIPGDMTTVTISLPRSERSLLDFEIVETNVKYPLRGEAKRAALSVLEEHPCEDYSIPQWIDSKSYIGFIRFTDRLKKYRAAPQWEWFAALYRENVCYVLQLWEEFLGIPLTPKKIEVAVDTWDQLKGPDLLKTFYPPWYDPAQLYHFKAGSKTNGPAPNGEHEYSGYSRKGRRVDHTYVKDLKTWPMPLYRAETQFNRTFLREHCRKHTLETCLDLVATLPYLVNRYIRFMSLDLNKVYKRYPEAKKWKLRRLSTRGRVHVLRNRGIERKEINRYLEPMPLQILPDMAMRHQ